MVGAICSDSFSTNRFVLTDVTRAHVVEMRSFMPDICVKFSTIMTILEINFINSIICEWVGFCLSHRSIGGHPAKEHFDLVTLLDRGF